MPFDIKAARSSGFSDDEIKTFLGEKFNVEGALGSGFTLEELADNYDFETGPEEIDEVIKPPSFESDLLSEPTFQTAEAGTTAIKGLPPGAPAAREAPILGSFKEPEPEKPAPIPITGPDVGRPLIEGTAIPAQKIAVKTAEAGVQGLASGLDQLGISLGNIIEYGGEKVDSDKIANLGKKIRKVYEERPAIKQGPPEEIRKKIYENPEVMRDPRWWSYNVGQIAPSLAAALAPGLAAKNIIQVAGKALPLTAKVVGRLATLGGSITGGVAGGALEGSSTYREMKDGGATEKEAQTAAEMMTGASAVLNAISFGKLLSKAPKGILKKGMNAIISGATEAITEWLEEPSEVIAKRTATGKIKDIPETVKEAVKSIKDGMDVAPPSFLLGMIGAAGAPSFNVSEEQQTASPKFEIDREAAKADGFTEEEISLFEAEQQMMAEMIKRRKDVPKEGIFLQDQENEILADRLKSEFEGTGLELTKENVKSWWKDLTGESINRESAQELIKQIYGATPAALQQEATNAGQSTQPATETVTDQETITPVEETAPGQAQEEGVIPEQPQTGQTEVVQEERSETPSPLPHGTVEVKNKRIDFTTGIPDQATTKEYVKNSYKAGKEVFTFDIDDFKSVNDEYGHQSGDEVLEALGAKVSEHFGKDAEFLGREGGEEFSVVFSKRPDIKKLQDFLNDVSENVKIDNQSVTISGGYGKGLSDNNNGYADELAYEAKQSGKNQIVVDFDGKKVILKGKAGEKTYVDRQDLIQTKNRLQRRLQSKTLSPEDRKSIEGAISVLEKQLGDSVRETTAGVQKKPTTPKTTDQLVEENKKKLAEAEETAGKLKKLVPESGTTVTKQRKSPTQKTESQSGEPPGKKPPNKTESQEEGDEKKRKTPETLEKGGLQKGTSLTYTPKSHAETEAIADEIIKKKGTKGAASWVKNEEKPSSEHTAVGLKVIAALQNESDKVRNENPNEADALMEDAIEVATSMSERLTKIGQEVEAVKMISALSPDAIVFTVKRNIDRANKKLPKKNQIVLTSETAKSLREKAKEAKTWEGMNTEARNLAKSVEEVLSKKEFTADDIQTLRDYKDQMDNILLHPPKQVKPKRKSFVQILEGSLDKKAAEAKARYNERHKGETLQIPTEDIIDLTIIGSAKIMKTGLNFAKWSGSMISDFGKPVTPHLNKIWEKSKKHFNAEKRQIRRLQQESKNIKDLLEKIESGTIAEDLDVERYKKSIEQIEKLSGEARTEAVLELKQQVEGIFPASKLQKIATLQTMAQLLNLKTIGRNIIGNEAFYRVERFNKYMATALDVVVSKVTGERTITYDAAGQSGYFEGLIRGSRMAWKGLAPGGLETQFDLKGQTFTGNNPITFLEKVMGVALRGTDYASYLRARNNTMGEIAVVAAINKGLKGDAKKKFVQDFIKNADNVSVEIADEYGKYATFQDINILTKTFVGLKHLLNAHKEFGVGDLVLKYPKTPANLLGRAIDYSPIGVTKSIYELGRVMSGHEFNQRAFVNALSRSIIGTVGFTGFGYFLMMNGVLTGSPEDWAEKEFKRQTTGEGPYKVNVSAIKRWLLDGFKKSSLTTKDGDYLVSYDWAQPLAVSLAIGANTARQAQESAGKKISGNNVLDVLIEVLSGGIQTIAEQPLLTGIQTLFGPSYNDTDKGQAFLKSFGKVAEQAPASFFPTLIYQIRQATDNTARETTDPNILKRALNKVVNKIPFFNENLPKAYKQLGVDPKTIYAEGQNTLFNVFLNPSFVSTYKVDPIIETILNPLKTEGLKGQLPKIAPTKIRTSKKKVELIAYEALKRKPGFNNLSLPDKQKQVAKYLEDKDIKLKNQTFEVKLTGKERSEMQRFLASRTDKLFRVVITDGLKNAPAEQQEKILGKFINMVSDVAKVNILRQKMNLKLKDIKVGE